MKPVGWFFRARHVRWIEDPSGWLARRNQHVARSRSARRGWWWARWRNGSAVGRLRKDGLGPASLCARFAGKRVTQNSGCSLQDSPALVPRCTAPLRNQQGLLYLRTPSPQAPRPSPQCSVKVAKSPQNWPNGPERLAALDAP